MDNSYLQAAEAYASNPRYSEGGLEAAKEREELEEARKVDTQKAALAEMSPQYGEQDPKLASPVPLGDPNPELDKLEAESQALKAEREASLENDRMIQMHEKVLKTIDAMTRVPRDIAGGLQKATDNTLALIVGRENLDKANNDLAKAMPGLNEFIKDYEKGIHAEGTVSKVTQEMVQFLGPMGAYVKALNAMNYTSKLGAVSKYAIADILASGTAIDPHIERLSTFAKSAGVDNILIDYLANDADETEMEGRFKNIIENSALGAGAGAVLWGAVKTTKALWRGAKESHLYGAAEKAEWDKSAIDVNLIKKSDDSIEESFLSSQAGRQFDETMRLAPEDQAWLSSQLSSIDARLGTFHANPGAKSAERAATKLPRESTDASRITDIARAGWTVENMAQADSLVKEMAKRMPVMDEGYKVTAAGYFDRKALIRTPNGTVAEVQVWDPVMLNAKESHGHKMYESWGEVTYREGPSKGRPLPGKEAEAKKLQDDMINLYVDAAAKMPDEAKQLYLANAKKLEAALEDAGLSYKDLEARVLNSSSSNGRPLVNTSGVKAGSNLPLTSEKASIGDLPGSGPDTKMAGEPLKSKKASGLPGYSINNSLSPQQVQSVAETHRLIKNYKPLPENPAKYFTNPDKTKLVDISKLNPIRQREKGVRNAHKFMKKAFDGTGAKRKPITVYKNEDGTYTIHDGNSTYANALASGWKKIPVQVIKAPN